MKYGFIGCGNMGGAIVRALRKSTDQIAVSDRSGKAGILAEELQIAYWDNERIAAECDILFLGVKPHMMKDMLYPLRETLARRKPVLVSMAAGLTVKTVEAFAGCSLPVIRIMPNTPTAIGAGVIAYCHNELVSEAVLADWLRDMAPCGLVDGLEERLMDAFSALSGSGPAYIYVFLEALADGAVSCGIPREKAMEYAAMTMAGSARMYLSTHQHPGTLKDAVCSPGGSTIAGIRQLEEHGFRAAAMECVIAACERNHQLGEQ